MAKQVKRLVNTVDLLYKVEDSFNSRVDPPSLIEELVRKKQLKKKEIKFLASKDSHTQATFLYDKFFRYHIIPCQDFIDLLKATNNDKNTVFADQLQRMYDESEDQFKMQTSSLSVEPEEDGQTVLQDQDTELLLQKPPVQPSLRADTLTTGPMLIHAHPAEPASAVFTCEGGILYSPYHGVTVSIPEGAIPDKLRVTVSFWLVTDENKRCQLLDHPDFPLTAILIGCLFEFTATIETKTGPAENLDAFERDVWLSIPVFAYPTSESKTSSFSVLVENNGRLEREQSAIFAYSYPYVNVSTRHFSKRVAVEETNTFSQNRINKRDISAFDNICTYVKNLSFKKKPANHQLDRIPSNPRPDSSEEVRQSASHHANSPRTKRSLFAEMKKVSDEVSTSQEKDQPKTNGMQETSQLNGQHSNVEFPEVVSPEYFTESEPMDIEYPRRSFENHSLPTFQLCLWVIGPEARHDKLEWSVDLCLLPDLPDSFIQMNRLIAESKGKLSFRLFQFNWKSNQDKVNFTSVSNHSPEWSVQLTRHQISIHEVSLITTLFSCRLLSLESLPLARATVKNKGAKFGLHHEITVEESEPEVSFFLNSQQTYDPMPSLRKTLSARDGPCYLSGKTDRCFLALLSVVLLPSEFRRLGEELCLETRVLKDIESDHLVYNVGERIYNVFCKAKSFTMGRLSTFLTPLDEWDQYIKYVRLLQNYCTYKAQQPMESFQGIEYCVDFVPWALKALHCVPLEADGLDTPLIDAKRNNLFLELYRKIVHVWKMFGRFFGIEDSELDSIAFECRNDLSGEAPWQMLQRLAQQFPQVTLSHISSVLQLLALGTNSVGDVQHFISHSCITQQTCTD